MISSRRSFLTGLALVIAAPAIVKASNLMPVKSIFDPAIWFDEEAARLAIENLNSYHFIDNQAMAIRYTGKILIDLIPNIYSDPEIIEAKG